MGWISNPLSRLSGIQLSETRPSQIDTDTDTSDLSTKGRNSYAAVPESLSDEELPFIPASEVTKLTEGSLWIVIDSVVFDCSLFVSSHPGGEAVINSFCGEDCTWQFWRFHSKSHMQEWGRPLRIGQTSGVKNRFAEPKRYVGLRTLEEEW